MRLANPIWGAIGPAYRRRWVGRSPALGGAYVYSGPDRPRWRQGMHCWSVSLLEISARVEVWCGGPSTGEGAMRRLVLAACLMGLAVGCDRPAPPGSTASPS